MNAALAIASLPRPANGLLSAGDIHVRDLVGKPEPLVHSPAGQAALQGIIDFPPSRARHGPQVMRSPGLVMDAAFDQGDPGGNLGEHALPGLNLRATL